MALDTPPEQRAVPILFMNLEKLGEIEPHARVFSALIDKSLFFVLLAPWEDWVGLANTDWRSFRIPWSYTIDEDVFVRPDPPPSPDTLSWAPETYIDPYGEEIEVERPSWRPLGDATITEIPKLLNDAKWADLNFAFGSSLFETPVAHFFVRAFVAEGIDEFLAHVTAIEAAIGTTSDYGRKEQQSQTKHKRLSATTRLSARLAGLLGSASDAESYRKLFDIRSRFLHGRTMGPINSSERIEARRLARRTVSALVAAALSQPLEQSREQFLEGLLDVGVSLT